jgi:4-hydroxy-tetrahydrodipicolinate synthase
MKNILRNPIPSFSTPFLENGEIDFDAAEKMIDVYVESGFKVIMLTAGDSHYLTLSDDEIRKLTQKICEYNNGRMLVIAADSYHNTRDAVKLAEYSKSVGVDIQMVLPPDWANSCSAESMAEHYARVAELVPVMIVTNIFIPRGEKFALKCIDRALSLNQNIIAVKDDMCGIFARRLTARFSDKIAVIAGGQKQNHMNMHPYGESGYLSTYARFYPQIAHEYWNRINKNDLRGATEIIEEYDVPFFDLIGSFAGGFDSGIHGTLEIFGLAKRFRRKPYLTINGSEMEQLRNFFKAKGILF